MGLDWMLFEGPASSDMLYFRDPQNSLSLSCISLECWRKYSNDHMLRPIPQESQAANCLVFCLPISCTCSSSLAAVSCRSWSNLLFTLMISSIFENRTSRSPCGSWKEQRHHGRSLRSSVEWLFLKALDSSLEQSHHWGSTTLGKTVPVECLQGLWNFIIRYFHYSTRRERETKCSAWKESWTVLS